MWNVTLETFTDGLTQLRQALADADPLAAPSDGTPFAATADAVADAFVAASVHDRARFLLRALDDAIAAVEVAARLADDLYGFGAGNGPEAAEPATDAGDDPLLTTYRAFMESQPAYAALYQYRNTLAAMMRLHARPVPDAVLATSAEPGADTPAPAAEAPTKPRRRSRTSLAPQA